MTLYNTWSQKQKPVHSQLLLPEAAEAWIYIGTAGKQEPFTRNSMGLPRQTETVVEVGANIWGYPDSPG